MKKLKLLVLLFIPCFCIPAFAERGVTVKGKSGAEAASGKTFKTTYYALIIGNNNYRNLPKLKTAALDAKDINQLLSQKYGFKTKLLIDASRKDILNAINDYRKKLDEKDSFLVYYAGHGEYNKIADEAFWLPVDAERDNPADWISANDITLNIKLIAAKHVLIVSDSCYSGALTRSATTDVDRKGNRNQFLAKMLQRASRTVMASGGNEPVADAGGRGNHSVFASAFLMAMNDPDKKIFTAEELFNGRVKEIVAGKSEQVPQYNNIRNSGHEGGDFVFQLAQASGTEEDAAAAEVSSYDSRNDDRQERRFIISEKTVLDTNTMLVWAKGIFYSERPTAFEDIDAYIRESNNQKYGGFDDWRKPTLEEFKGLEHFAASQGYANRIESLFNKVGFLNILPGPYVTSNYYAGGPYLSQDIWNPNNVESKDGGLTPHVWLVRGTPTVKLAETERFIFYTDVATDKTTGLAWMKDANRTKGGAVSFEVAESYVKKLNEERYAGCNKWDFPTKDEIDRVAQFLNNVEFKKAGGISGYWAGQVQTVDRWQKGVIPKGGLSIFRNGVGMVTYDGGLHYVWPICRNNE